jgi:hypothetical protein
MTGKRLNLLPSEGVKGDRAKTFYIGAQRDLLPMRDSAFPYMKRLGLSPFTPSPAPYINDFDDIRAIPALHHPFTLTTTEVS